MYFGSLFHLGTVVLVLLMTAVLWWLLKKKNEKVQRSVVLGLMFLNTLQHFLKSLLYPQYFGMGFTLYNTAYNVCAVLIISAPLIFMWGNRFLKNCLIFIGLPAGIGTILFPFWFFGTPVRELGWHYFRFYLCHSLLFVSCLLPIILGLYKPKYQEFWQIGLGFLLTLCVVLLNNVIFMSVGLYPEGVGTSLYDQLLRINPCLMMAPKGDFVLLESILKIATPSVFLGNNPSGCYAPILWYALPVYCGITVAAFVILVLLDWKEFRKNRKKH